MGKSEFGGAHNVDSDWHGAYWLRQVRLRAARAFAQSLLHLYKLPVYLVRARRAVATMPTEFSPCLERDEVAHARQLLLGVEGGVFVTATPSRRRSPVAAAMKPTPSAVIVLLMLGGVALFETTPAQAHGWYPKECCNDMDCAPVENIARFVPAGGGPAQLIVTSKHGTALVPENFPVRESKDARAHVCMRHSPDDPFGDMGVVCLFIPPSM
jgi:hypothetical protein